MQTSPSNPNPNPNPKDPSSPCEECELNPWKYRCPGCSIRSCSLPCVKSHKQRTGCTGKRDALTSHVVTLSLFSDDLLISDYKLLEETKRLAESSRRMRDEVDENSLIRLPQSRTRNGVVANPVIMLPRRLLPLWKAARTRKISLFFMPTGMSKREKNQSLFSWSTKSISWTIEWRFHSADISLMDHGVPESVSLSTVIEKHLTPGPWNDQLRPYRDVQLDDLKFLLRKNPKNPKSPFLELNIKAPIQQQLAMTVVLEYPVIHIFLPSDSYDFKVERVEQPFPKKVEHSVSPSRTPSPKGTYFMEEEVEEGEVVSDYVNSAPRDSIRFPKDATVAEKAGNPGVQMLRAAMEVSKCFSGDNRGARVVEEGNRSSKSSMNSMKKSSEDANFDFEKEVTDAYSDFIGEMNPDDFLCFDGFDGIDGNYEFEEELQGEELEEGEIPN